MTGIIVTTPPTVELPPGSTSSNPATLPPVTYRYALLNIPQTWTAKQTFPLGMITLNAADITGTLPAADLPPPTTVTLGGIFSKANVLHQWLNSIGTDGTPASSQPAFTDISGSVAATQMPALTGDVTTVAGAVATTLATVNANVGSFGTATQVSQFSVNAKGLITAAVNVTITPAIGSITGLGTGVATALAINVGSAGAPVTFNGALGTPASGTGTNLTGIPTTALTGALQAAQEPAHTGDVTNSAASLALTIANNAVTNAKAAQMAANTIKGNNTGGIANAADLTVANVATMLATAGVVPVAYKVVTFTRVMSLASGTQAVTGVGFVPRFIQFQTGISGGAATGSIGQSDVAGNSCLELQTSGFAPQPNAGIQREVAGGGNFNTFVVTSMDSDGFTVTWTKTGAPTLTAAVSATCYR